MAAANKDIFLWDYLNFFINIFGLIIVNFGFMFLSSFASRLNERLLKIMTIILLG